MGDNINARLFSIYAANTKINPDIIVNIQTERTLTEPVGKARLEVRGLILSYFISTMRLNAIAQLRAPTIATNIHKILANSGQPFDAKNALITA